MQIAIYLNGEVIKEFYNPAGCRREADAWCIGNGYRVTERWVGPRGHCQEWEVEHGVL